MSSWHPNDLVSDVDLLAYEASILTQFDRTDWQDKRTKALEDWVFPILRAAGFDPDALRTRAEPTKVWGFTAAAYTDLTNAATSTTTDDVNLATVFTTVGTDILYIGSTKPFRGLSLRLLENVSAVAALVTVAYWGDSWTSLAIADQTQKTTGKSFSGGGAITWRQPVDWVTRAINSSDRLYWVKVTISATPTSAKAAQIAVIRRSVLCAPSAFRTLELIFREASTTQGAGPWLDKAAFYKVEADLALERALAAVGSEIDTDASDEISDTETAQTSEEAGGGTFRMERG